MMDIEKDYSCLEHNKVVLNKNIDVESEFQESLPAYCDDIYRVIKCVSNSFVTSVDIHFNEVKIFGKTEICLTYLNENYNLSYADFEEEFNKTIELENLSETAFCDFNICDKYTNFRVINQRRIDIHTTSMISLKVYDKVKCPCLSSCTDSKLKTEKMKTADIIASDISKIDFDEEFKVPADSPPIKRIVSHEAFVSVNETKIIKDKALI